MVVTATPRHRAPGCYGDGQDLASIRAPRSGGRSDRPAEREPGDIRLPAEPVPEEFQERHRVGCHPLHADTGPVLASPQRTTAAALAPVDDGEGLFQPQEVPEAARFVDHRQAGTLLDQQQHRIGRVRPANPDPLRGAAGLIASSVSISIGLLST